VGELRREGGFALPLALVALVALSLLLSTALITASQERSMSAAHADAMRARYAAQGAIAAFLGARPAALAADSGSAVYAPPRGAPVLLRFLRLGEAPLAGDSTLRVVAILARPEGGDAPAVAALVKVLIAPPDASGVPAPGGPDGPAGKGPGGAPVQPIIRAVSAWTEVAE
jgi:hypothetical protein